LISKHSATLFSSCTSYQYQDFMLSIMVCRRPLASKVSMDFSIAGTVVNSKFGHLPVYGNSTSNSPLRGIFQGCGYTRMIRILFIEWEV